MGMKNMQAKKKEDIVAQGYWATIEHKSRLQYHLDTRRQNTRFHTGEKIK